MVFTTDQQAKIKIKKKTKKKWKGSSIDVGNIDVGEISTDLFHCLSNSWLRYGKVWCRVFRAIVLTMGEFQKVEFFQCLYL